MSGEFQYYVEQILIVCGFFFGLKSFYHSLRQLNLRKSDRSESVRHLRLTFLYGALFVLTLVSFPLLFGSER